VSGFRAMPSVEFLLFKLQASISNFKKCNKVEIKKCNKVEIKKIPYPSRKS
jgi:hypothetical protein